MWMYGYYFLSTLGFSPFWKKALTQMQLLQFCFMITEVRATPPLPPFLPVVVSALLLCSPLFSSVVAGCAAALCNGLWLSVALSFGSGVVVVVSTTATDCRRRHGRCHSPTRSPPPPPPPSWFTRAHHGQGLYLTIFGARGFRPLGTINGIYALTLLFLFLKFFKKTYKGLFLSDWLG